MKLSAVVEIAHVLQTNREVSLAWNISQRFGRLKQQRDKVKLSLGKVAFMISCTCTNRVCGVAGMKGRKREKMRVGEKREYSVRTC